MRGIFYIFFLWKCGVVMSLEWKRHIFIWEMFRIPSRSQMFHSKPFPHALSVGKQSISNEREFWVFPLPNGMFSILKIFFYVNNWNKQTNSKQFYENGEFGNQEEEEKYDNDLILSVLYENEAQSISREGSNNKISIRFVLKCLISFYFIFTDIPGPLLLAKLMNDFDEVLSILFHRVDIWINYSLLIENLNKYFSLLNHSYFVTNVMFWTI